MATSKSQFLGYMGGDEGSRSGPVTAGDGLRLGTWRLVSSWKTPRSHVSSRMFQLNVLVDGVWYSARSPGVGMYITGKAKVAPKPRVKRKPSRHHHPGYRVSHVGSKWLQRHGASWALYGPDGLHIKDFYFSHEAHLVADSLYKQDNRNPTDAGMTARRRVEADVLATKPRVTRNPTKNVRHWHNDTGYRDPLPRAHAHAGGGKGHVHLMLRLHGYGRTRKSIQDGPRKQPQRGRGFTYFPNQPLQGPYHRGAM